MPQTEEILDVENPEHCKEPEFSYQDLIEIYRRGVALRMLGIADVERKTGIHRQTIFRWIKQGKYPKPGKYQGSNRNIWPEHVIETWIESTFEQEGAA
jgi:prophage regulatory protein